MAIRDSCVYTESRMDTGNPGNPGKLKNIFKKY